MALDIARIALLIRRDRQQRAETQEDYARGIGLTQTQISKLELSRMPKISGEVIVALLDRFGARLLRDGDAAGTRDAIPSTDPQGAPEWRDAMLQDATYREAWPKVHRLWVMSRRAGSRASENWDHLVKQIDMLLRLAQAEDGPPRKRRRRG